MPQGETNTKGEYFLIYVFFINIITLTFTVNNVKFHQFSLVRQFSHQKKTTITSEEYIALLKLGTDIRDEKVGASLYLTLQGKTKLLRELKPEDAGKKTGYNMIIAKSDTVYLQDEATRAVCAFHEF